MSKKGINNCTAAGCNCQPVKVVAQLWGNKVTEVGFCNDHEPEWLRDLKIGDFSPETTIFGITKSWYQRTK